MIEYSGLIEVSPLYTRTKSLYDVFYVEKTATQAELKKAYRKFSFFLCPLKKPCKEIDEKFQVLSEVHYILSDDNKRKLYDEKGVWKRHIPLKAICISGRISSDLEEYIERYRGSEEEAEDLKKAYIRAKGDMDVIAEIFIPYAPEERDSTLSKIYI
ncbi:dnaJ-like protein subfamily C member 9 [Caerostris darwini]|uniref:DnaJ-like protein subfamily C member 9 n=1 Tax=Caerostris darwini TaxID=1538125 RepID=A0AAV4PV46_9ARAC|nr:dnaJ-like protein subfamily C member 9 [Caerostris darwini]